MWCDLNAYFKTLRRMYLCGPQWRYYRFKVTGMIKGYFWVWNFWFWDFFWVGKFELISHLSCLSTGFVVTEILLVVDISFNPFWSEIQHRTFFRVNFWSRDFFGRVGSLRDIFGCWFLQSFDHPVTWNPEFPPPPPLGYGFTSWTFKLQKIPGKEILRLSGSENVSEPSRNRPLVRERFNYYINHNTVRPL